MKELSVSGNESRVASDACAARQNEQREGRSFLPWDVSRCAREECASSRQCARFMCPGNPTRQVYSAFQPVNGRCGSFIQYLPSVEAPQGQVVQETSCSPDTKGGSDV